MSGPDSTTDADGDGPTERGAGAGTVDGREADRRTNRSRTELAGRPGVPLVDAELRIVVMGVAGSGKSTVGWALAERLGTAFLDADEVHPAANIAKMAAGIPLEDADRRPWLAALRDALVDRSPIVVTCSALRVPYRDELRLAGGVRFVFLDLSPALAVERVGDRADHFMASGMVAGQFDTLERPGAGERDVLTVDAGDPPAALVAQIGAWIEPGRDG